MMNDKRIANVDHTSEHLAENRLNDQEGHLWIDLTSENLNPPEKKKTERGRITVFISPYDVPEAVRGYYDTNKKCVVIEFRYLTDEAELEEIAQSAHVRIQIGRNSRRIYRIEINPVFIADSIEKNIEPQIKINRAKTAINAELKRFAVEHPQKRPNREGNYRITQSVIDLRGSEIFRSLVPTI